jgi:rRNA maturation protein Nop10
MGMYDHVEYTDSCPECGYIISVFQSKDRECLLDNLSVDEVNNFHEICPVCGGFVEYKRKDGNIFEVYVDNKFYYEKEIKMEITLERKETYSEGEPKKITMEVGDNMDIHEFKNLCIRMALSLGYSPDNVKEVLGEED